MRFRYFLASGLALLLPMLLQAQTGTGQAGAGQTGQAGVGSGQAGQAGQTSPFGTPLYRNDAVARSLNLTPQQTNRLNTYTQQLQQRYQTQFNQFNNLQPNDRTARMQELQQRYNTDWMGGVGDIFNQQQLSRYRQLDLQRRGVGAFFDPTIQKQLNLTDQQVGQLRQLQDWARQQQQTINTPNRANPTNTERIRNAYQTQYQDRLNRILNDQQQRTWQGLTGAPFNFGTSGTGSSTTGGTSGGTTGGGPK